MKKITFALRLWSPENEVFCTIDSFSGDTKKKAIANMKTTLKNIGYGLISYKIF